MTQRFQITLAQLNPAVGALEANAAKARAAWEEAKAQGSDLLALSEMFITGYQTQDLILKPAFQSAALRALEELARECADGPAMLIGAPALREGRLYNAYHLLEGGSGRIAALKHQLPNEGVFDERRLFSVGEIHGPYTLSGAGAEGMRIGSPICEDAWSGDVPQTMAETGAELLLVPNGSPYHRAKLDLRLNLMVARVVETGLPLVYLNMVGGQDDQVFDGGSFVLNPGGELAVQMPQFDEALAHVVFERPSQGEGWHARRGTLASLAASDIETDYRACVCALADYMGKSGFKRAVLGLSGGIDSALVAAMAADAIGPENLRCVMLPSRYTSAHSLEDARTTAHALGCTLGSLPITAPQEAMHKALEGAFAGLPADLTEENLQARLRGLLLMALSNKFGEMLLTTGNKSEMAVGYCTIYGDMNGGYNPLKDMYKTRVFAAARWRNANHRPWMKGPSKEVIAPRILTKAPSAELRPDQRDQDSLPPYDLLDQILEGLIEQEASIADLIARGFEREAVEQAARLLFASEHKRFQAAPGPKLTSKALWLDRRYPLVNRWREGG